jgi:DUF1680 family protein
LQPGTLAARVIAEGKVRTYDIGGKDSTLDVAKAIADYASNDMPAIGQTRRGVGGKN